MTKQTIIITGCEDSDDGKRTTFKTNKGKMSAFKTDLKGNPLGLVQTLKSHLDKPIEVEVFTSEQTNQAGNPYLNIKKFYGEGKADEVKSPIPVEIPVPVIRAIPVKTDNFKATTMYPSYAKDVLVAMINSGNINGKHSDMMSCAIELVKQAKEAFS